MYFLDWLFLLLWGMSWMVFWIGFVSSASSEGSKPKGVSRTWLVGLWLKRFAVEDEWNTARSCLRRVLAQSVEEGTVEQLGKGQNKRFRRVVQVDDKSDEDYDTETEEEEVADEDYEDVEEEEEEEEEENSDPLSRLLHYDIVVNRPYVLAKDREEAVDIVGEINQRFNRKFIVDDV